MNRTSGQQLEKSSWAVRPAFLRSIAVVMAALFGAAYALLHTPAFRDLACPLAPSVFLFLREKLGNVAPWPWALAALLGWACVVAFPFAVCVAVYDFVLLRRKNINRWCLVLSVSIVVAIALIVCVSGFLMPAAGG